MLDDINGASEERAYFLQVLQTFQSYRHQSLLRIKHREDCLTTLPPHHKSWLEKYKKDLESFKEAVECNSKLIPIITEHAKNIFGNIYCTSSDTTHSETSVGTLSEGLNKVQSVFKHLMRDWSTMGAMERAQCYDPILSALEEEFPADQHDRSEISVLVPGAGLGRLAYEIAAREFKCEGNEFNLFMLIVSFYALNHCKKVEEFEIYPWIHEYCNHLSAEHQTISVKFPDVLPKLEGDKFTMIAGDFLEVYTVFDAWNCIATCFFIDCAPNVVQFIEAIYNLLKPGGVWINLGPLLYHYSDMRNERSIEPSFEVLCNVAKSVGFAMERNEIGLKTRYCQNPKSMLQYEYESVFFVCRKPDTV